MIRVIEYLLNGLIWCIHDIGRSLKDNPLTRAWRDMPEQEWGRLKAPDFQASAKAVICDNPRRSIGSLTIEAARRAKRKRNRDALRQISKDIEKMGSVKINTFGQKL